MDRTRRLYLVFWPTICTFKIGVEASFTSTRVSKWQRLGAIIVAIWELPEGHSSLDSRTLFGVEQIVVATLLAEKQAKPPIADWLKVVPPLTRRSRRPDGYRETFLLGNYSLDNITALLESHIHAVGLASLAKRSTVARADSFAMNSGDAS